MSDTQTPCLKLIEEIFYAAPPEMQYYLRDKPQDFRWMIPPPMTFLIELEVMELRRDFQYIRPVQIDIERNTIFGITVQPSPEMVIYLFHKTSATSGEMMVKVPLIPSLTQKTGGLQKVIVKIEKTIKNPPREIERRMN
jgi:hypothetical protein